MCAHACVTESQELDPGVGTHLLQGGSQCCVLRMSWAGILPRGEDLLLVRRLFQFLFRCRGEIQ